MVVLRRFLLSALLVGFALPLSSCATLGVSILGAGAGMLADRSIDHILKSTVSKTFPATLEETRMATLRSIQEMDLTLKEFERTESGYSVTGQANNRSVEIELEQVSTQITRMRVDVKRNFFLRDRSTADAIVAQTEMTLSQIKPADRSTPIASKSRPQAPTAEILRTSYDLYAGSSAGRGTPAQQDRNQPDVIKHGTPIFFSHQQVSYFP